MFWAMERGDAEVSVARANRFDRAVAIPGQKAQGSAAVFRVISDRFAQQVEIDAFAGRQAFVDLSRSVQRGRVREDDCVQARWLVVGLDPAEIVFGARS